MQIQQSPLQGIRLKTCTSLTTGTLGAVPGGAKMTSKEPQEVTVQGEAEQQQKRFQVGTLKLNISLF